MEKETNNNNQEGMEELINELESGDYKHLQIFVYRDEPNHIFGMGERHLVVNHSGYTMFKLTSLEFNNGNIQVEFTNPDTENPVTVNLDVKSALPDIFLIKWEDFLDLSYADRTNPDEELLQLDRE